MTGGSIFAASIILIAMAGCNNSSVQSTERAYYNYLQTGNDDSLQIVLRSNRRDVLAIVRSGAAAYEPLELDRELRVLSELLPDSASLFAEAVATRGPYDDKYQRLAAMQSDLSFQRKLIVLGRSGGNVERRTAKYILTQSQIRGRLDHTLAPLVIKLLSDDLSSTDEGDAKVAAYYLLAFGPKAESALVEAIVTKPQQWRQIMTIVKRDKTKMAMLVIETIAKVRDDEIEQHLRVLEAGGR